jgi:hypothetical protein
MSEFTDYTDAINARLAAAFAVAAGPWANIALIVEDAEDLQTEVDTAINQTGMVVLIGMPNLDNTVQSIAIADLKITSAIAVGENPVIWRDAPLTKPKCLNVVKAIIANTQGLLVPGFAQRLHVASARFVPDKKRQLYEITIESRVIVDATT